MLTGKTQFAVSQGGSTVVPMRKKKSILGVSDGTVTKQLFHLLESTHKRYFFSFKLTFVMTPIYAYKGISMLCNNAAVFWGEG